MTEPHSTDSDQTSVAPRRGFAHALPIGTKLGEFEITERIIKLNDTLDNVEWEYARILERLESPRPEAESEANGAGSSHGKRKSDGEEEGPSSKKARVDDE